MITIDQLLESVDFEPRWVTKDKAGLVMLWNKKPRQHSKWFIWILEKSFFNEFESCGHIKLAEFEGRDWTECIYEVPRKTTGDIKKIETMPRGEYATAFSLFDIALKVNEIIDKIETLEERTEDVCARIIEVERKVL